MMYFRNRKPLTVILIVLILSALHSGAQTRVSLIFSDSMVLQRETLAAIWGNDNPNVSVTVSASWGASGTALTDANGKWKVKIQTPAAGGPFTVQVNGSSQIVIKDVLIGEVWFCAGQSNMEMPMKGYLNTSPVQPVDSSDYFIAHSNNPNLRLFKSGWNPVSRTPLDSLRSPGEWNAASTSATPEFSATAYFFARRLQEALQVPVGVIVAARGGSNIESWLDSTSLADIKPVVIPAVLNWQTANVTPTMMFNTSLHPYIGYTIKGIIWSQGEANRTNHFEYQRLFTKLIQSWREKWGQGKFPFYYAEVAPRGGIATFDPVSLREAQLHTMLTVDATGMGSTMDIGHPPHDHYPRKKVIGDRLALWALIRDYGFPGIPSGPIFKGLEINGNTIKLFFDYVGGGLTTRNNQPLIDFEIAGANNVFYPAVATFADNNTTINVTSASVPQPLYVRYAWKNSVVGSLYNMEDLPAPSFRTQQMQIILPIKFGNISLQSLKNDRLIKWNTLLETDVKHFELERSLDAVAYSRIYTTPAKGMAAAYEYRDQHNITNGSVVYYRIKVIFKDGHSEFSKIVSTKSPTALDKIQIVNPATGNIQLYFPNQLSCGIMVSDHAGKLLAVKNVRNQSGTLALQIPGVYKGMAFITIVAQNRESVTKKVLIL